VNINIHKKYKDYKLEYNDAPIDVDVFPDYPKIKVIRKYTENYGIDDM
jgi:hypothetical protein